MKKRIILVAMVVVLIVIFALPLKHAKAGTLPSILYSDLGRLIMEVADLGVIFGNQVQLAVYTEWPSPVNIAICWKMYYPGRATFAIPVMGTDVWVVHGKFGVWTGSGSTAYVIRALDGYTWTEVITTSPPDLPASSAEAPDQM